MWIWILISPSLRMGSEDNPSQDGDLEIKRCVFLLDLRIVEEAIVLVLIPQTRR